ncbi:1-deoxy-D-xylulose-5-phosphate reductoisomerase [candidate division WOR-3 bacterium]|nr:1-deoxy-D-xylulose-5-phosphate reductoisomerase [candidate division WOR-3 bacterium]
MKRITILGSTGSIGKNTLDVIRHQSQLTVRALACYSNIDALILQAETFHPDYLCIINKNKYKELKEKVGNKYNILIGYEGCEELAMDKKTDIVVVSTVGSKIVKAFIKAIESGKRIAIANKESLVAYGYILTDLIKKNSDRIIPVDSEHSAIYQCLLGNRRRDLKRIILTASGGPFRNRDDLNNITIEDALKHPNWIMGKKITIDSATLFNKGLEVNEAHTLFGVSPEEIEVFIHHQSIIHSMVEYKDGSIIAQMSLPDMRIPIQYALSFPKRWQGIVKSIDFDDIKELTFDKPDFKKFPLLKIALKAMQIGGTMPAVISRADELAVNAFLEGKIKFLDIVSIIQKTFAEHKVITDPSIKDIENAESWASENAKRLIEKC